MAVNPELKITRKQLSAFIKDHNTLIQFEKLFNQFNVVQDDVENGGSTVENIVIVAKSGGDYKTIKEALDSITDSSSIKRYTIQVAPGVYVEDNTAAPLKLKDYVGIAASSIRAVVVIPEDSTLDLFEGANFAYLDGLVFANTATGWVLNHNFAGNISVINCVLRDCGLGFQVNGPASILEVANLAVNTPGGSVTTSYAIKASQGTFVFQNIVARLNSIIDTLIDVSGATTFGLIVNIASSSLSLTTGLKAYDGVVMSGSVFNVIGPTDGIVVYGDNTDVRLDTVKIINPLNDGFRIENIGTNVNFSLFSATITGAGRYNFNIENPNSVSVGDGYTELDNSFVAPGASLYASVIDTKEDDEGRVNYGQFAVGSPERPAESIFGSGDSYTRGMLVYTETELGVFVDVSEEARSASGSTFTFPGVVADNSIYVCSSLTDGTDFLEHFGIKSKVGTAAVKGTGEIVIEYWDGATWTEVNGMEADSSGEYYPHAKDYFQDIGGHHIRYNSKLAVDSWTKNDPMLLGVSYYWVRFRIATAITTAPILEQFKLHTNRKEINSDGWPEYFGKARPIGQLPLSIGGDRSFTGVVQNQSIWINQNVAAGLIENRFTTTTGYVGRYFFAPLDLDTSSPIEFILAGRPNGTGQVEITVGYDVTTEGDLAYTSDPGLLPGKRTVSESRAVVDGEIEIYTLLLDVSDVIARREGGTPDFICLSINTSILGITNFDMMAIEANYTKWSNGGHIG